LTTGAGEKSGPQYSPDGNWITFWVGDGAAAYIAKVPAASESETTYTMVVDNDVAGDAGMQDYFPSYWDSSRLIYTSWDTAQLPGVNDDDIRVLNLTFGDDYLAAFNSPYPVDDSDAFPINSALLGFSKRQGAYWELWYGDPVVGGSVTLGISDANKHNLGGEYTPTVVPYVPNSSPTDISLSNSTVSENQPSGTQVGTLSTTDPDTGNTFTYTLVSGAGSTDNASFTISGSMLQTSASFNYEVKNSYSVRVRTTDQDDLWYEEAFTITVTDVNDTPTDIGLSPDTVAENQPSGTQVGTLSTTDPDADNTFTYTLVSGAGSTDNVSFTISGSTLQTAASFNYEVKNSLSVRVRTTDQGSRWYEEAFTITVINVYEDSDGDGIRDSDDNCPEDANKTEPGTCDCGVADIDSDSDGTPDCNDGCINDPSKTEPGTCDCGVADTDSDSDGTPDCNDNCPEIFNPEQADKNSDGKGDSCDFSWILFLPSLIK
jgi:hypothetical protein